METGRLYQNETVFFNGKWHQVIKDFYLISQAIAQFCHLIVLLFFHSYLEVTLFCWLLRTNPVMLYLTFSKYSEAQLFSNTQTQICIPSLSRRPCCLFRWQTIWHNFNLPWFSTFAGSNNFFKIPTYSKSGFQNQQIFY